MPDDQKVDEAQALELVRQFALDARASVRSRNAAIRNASKLGVSGRAIAREAGLSHRAVQMILASDD
ncbi:MAG: hypothetical protein JO337_04790 [Acidimicrobiales bacterium]|nr:hypothetical protein [Acidimicrobiales bacterium]